MNFNQQESLFSPSHQQNNQYDSLVFSMTSQNLTNNKIHLNSLSLPKQTILIDSKGQEISRELLMLQNKLTMLEGKVQQIKTDRQEFYKEKQNTENQQNTNKRDGNGLLTVKRLPTKDKQKTRTHSHKNNKDSQNNRWINHLTNINNDNERYYVGKFKKGSQMKSKGKVILTKNDQNLFTPVTNEKLRQKSLNNDSIRSEKSLSYSTKECNHLKKQMIRLKMEAQRNNRSKEKVIQQLSDSKSKIKTLNKSKCEYQRNIDQLTKKLNKSQAIRQKQKSIILNQKLEIQELKNLLKAKPKILRC